MDFDQWGNEMEGSGQMGYGSSEYGSWEYGGYQDEDEEEDEKEALIRRVAVCMNLLPGEGFDEDVFANACYMAGVDPEIFSEQDMETLMEML